ELMAVDAAVDHEPGGEDRGIAPGLCENLRMQRDLETAGHFEQIDLRRRNAARLDLGKECDTAFLDHLAMPGRLHEGDALRFGESPVLRRRRGTIFLRVCYFGV